MLVKWLLAKQAHKTDKKFHAQLNPTTTTQLWNVPFSISSQVIVCFWNEK